MSVMYCECGVLLCLTPRKAAHVVQPKHTQWSETAPEEKSAPSTTCVAYGVHDSACISSCRADVDDRFQTAAVTMDVGARCCRQKKPASPGPGPRRTFSCCG